jgi:hypothetical protein
VAEKETVRRSVSPPNELAAGLGEGQVAELVEHKEVEAAEEIGCAALLAAAGFGIELVHEIDDVEEPPSSAGAHDADGKVRFARARAADQHEIALLLEE